MPIVRDNVATLFRTIPNFKGKALLGLTLERWLFKYTEDKDCIVKFKMRDGSVMKIDLRSKLEHWTFYTGIYEQKVLKRFTECLQPNWVVFDVGANIGFWSVPMGRKLKGIGGEVYAFEPLIANYNRLLEILSFNDLEEVVKPINIALGDEEGTVAFHYEDMNNAKTGNASLHRGGIALETKQNATVRIARLDQVVEENKITGCNFIKADIEGAELMFLKGGENFIRKHRPIIYGEFNDYVMKRFGQSFLEVVELTAPWGYNFYKQVGKNKQFVKIIKPEAGTENVLMIPQGTSSQLLASLGVVEF